MAGLKIGGLIVIGIALLLGLAGLAVYLLTQTAIGADAVAPADALVIHTDVATLQRGQHLAGAIARCTACHGPTLGGAIVRDDFAVRVIAPNLTRPRRSDTDLARAIRYGVDPTGRQLWLMPTDEYTVLSDSDLAALIAYLDALPPSPTVALPPNQLRPLGRALFALGRLDLLPASRIDRATPRPRDLDVRVGVTPAYGAYLVTVAGCASCHGPGLTGTRAASDLTPSGLGAWDEAAFVRAMRTGQRPDGSRIDPSMPWPYFAQMTDLELSAIWQYLGVIPSRA